MAGEDVRKWDRIYRDRNSQPAPAARVLAENLHLLPASGRALDVACGRGSNALLLAQHGLETHAWDISNEALRQLQDRMPVPAVNLVACERDAVSQPPEPDSFDVIVVSRFLDRLLIPALIKSLRGNGLIFYQTFLADKAGAAGPTNPDYLLLANELLEMFRPLHIILYREEGLVGNLDAGFRNEAMLIAQQGM